MCAQVADNEISPYFWVAHCANRDALSHHDVLISVNKFKKKKKRIAQYPFVGFIHGRFSYYFPFSRPAIDRLDEIMQEAVRGMVIYTLTEAVIPYCNWSRLRIANTHHAYYRKEKNKWLEVRRGAKLNRRSKNGICEVKIQRNIWLTLAKMTYSTATFSALFEDLRQQKLHYCIPTQPHSSSVRSTYN